jgi:hypothetical protein
MKISVLVSNLADNHIVRTYRILKVLERRYEIDIIGPCFRRTYFGHMRVNSTLKLSKYVTTRNSPKNEGHI